MTGSGTTTESVSFALSEPGEWLCLQLQRSLPFTISTVHNKQKKSSLMDTQRFFFLLHVEFPYTQVARLFCSNATRRSYARVPYCRAAILQRTDGQSGSPSASRLCLESYKHRRAYSKSIRLYRLRKRFSPQGQAGYSHAHTHRGKALFVRSLWSVLGNFLFFFFRR